MSHDDAHYFHTRAHDEIAAAQRATAREVQLAHYRLALAYLTRLASPRLASPRLACADAVNLKPAVKS